MSSAYTFECAVSGSTTITTSASRTASAASATRRPASSAFARDDDPWTQTDADVVAGVPEVQRVRVALAPEPEDRDPLPRQAPRDRHPSRSRSWPSSSLLPRRPGRHRRDHAGSLPTRRRLTRRRPCTPRHPPPAPRPHRPLPDAAVAARERDPPRPRQLDDPEVPQQLEQGGELVRRAGRLDRERLVRDVGRPARGTPGRTPGRAARASPSARTFTSISSRSTVSAGSCSRILITLISLFSCFVICSNGFLSTGDDDRHARQPGVARSVRPRASRC